MRVRPLLGAVVLVGLAVWNPACVNEPSIGGACSVSDDCQTWYNYWGGTVCIEGRCTCPLPYEAPCCPNGGHECEWNEFECRLSTICQQVTVEGVKIAPGGACSADDQCRDPIDRRCGPPVCRDGYCGYAIDFNEPIQSQYPGDCSINFCNREGDVDRRDASDYPFDGNDCTLDGCQGEEPSNERFPDGTPVPGMFSDYCIAGAVYDCYLPLMLDQCPQPYVCDWDKCVPWHCIDGVLSGDETGVDCGGSFCRGCDKGIPCVEGNDCMTRVCLDALCQAATHSDHEKNLGETGVDCGYLGGPPFQCQDGEGCKVETDCASQVCYNGICQAPTCTDARQNGSETTTDCGGSCPPCW